MSKGIKYTIISLSIIAILLIAGVSLLYQSRVTIDSSPSNVSFFFEEEYYTTPFTVKNLKPGTYELYTHVSGFEDYEEKIELGFWDKKNLMIELSKLSIEDAISKDEKKWVDSLEESTLESEKKLSERSTDNPLTKYLPKMSTEYWLDYSIDSSNDIHYYIKTDNYTSSLESAQEWVESIGLNPSNIQIEYAGPLNR
ncbi:MAG: PEGA domain-containing protein [Patescibacteria group bacterium]|nr:PEGA domain-containing protein [Patescibacteria group bacterium]